jgi:hypothetical protein
MRSYQKLTKLSVVVAALLLLGTALAVTQRTTVTPVTRVKVCIKDNGQLRVATGNTCDLSERLVEWVVGGEVTDLQLGRGLVGSRENGTIQLAVDPELIESCGNCNSGRVYAGFDDGPGDTPEGPFNPNHGEILPQIGALRVPTGKYLVHAKLWVHSKNEREFVYCKLSAGSDFDWAEVIIRDRDAAVVSLTMVHEVTEAEGLLVVGCSGLGTEWQDLKISALQVSNISNTFIGHD